MRRKNFISLLESIQQEERDVLSDGFEEYAHKVDNCLGNFDRIADKLGITREEVLLVFLEKHMDGIVSWVSGHRSQREDVTGRIKDARAYLALLWAMVVENVLTEGEKSYE